MATIVKIDDLYINLDTVAYVRLHHVDADEVAIVHFAAVAETTTDGVVEDLYVTLRGEHGARLLRWLDEGGRVSVA